jgi:hypothetical protein
MPQIELDFSIFDPKNPDPANWPEPDDAQVDQANGEFILRLEAKEYAPGGGALVITEVEPHAYGVATNEALANQFKANQQAGDGIYDLVIFDSSLLTDAEAQLRAEAELALRTQEKGSFSFDTYEDVEIGELVEYTDTEDDEFHDWPIQEITFSVVGIELKRSIKCSPVVEKTLAQLAGESFKAVNNAAKPRQIDINTATTQP